jgi:hypothetical protein
MIFFLQNHYYEVKKKLRSDYIINFIKKYFKKNRSDYFINLKKKIITVVTRGGPWVSPFIKQKLFRTKFMKSFTA